MKHFIFTVERKRANYGENILMHVYRIKQNIPEHIGDAFFNTGSMKGFESEAFTVIADTKHITRKLFNEVKGYYSWSMKETHGISITQLN